MQPLLQQLPLLPSEFYQSTSTSGVVVDQSNNVTPQDRAFHNWYRFVLSYPPHLVRGYLDGFNLTAGCTVLDPFCGTGTTIVEAKLNGIQGIGVEANPFAHFASSVKIDWRIEPELLLSRALEIADNAYKILQTQAIDDNAIFSGKENQLRSLKPESLKLLIKDSISPAPLHKTLVLLDCLKPHIDQPYYKPMLLALGNALVNSIGNLRFGPEVGIGKLKQDVPVIAKWLAEIRKMAADLKLVAGKDFPACTIHLGDARDICQFLQPHSIDAVITSPPYPNEKDYTRTTRLESVVLGFIEEMGELRRIKKNAPAFRSARRVPS